MKNLARALCAAFTILACGTLVRAEEGILVLLVMNTQDRPLKGVTISVGGDGGTGTSQSDGRARIRLANGTSVNSVVHIYITDTPVHPEKNVPMDLVFISPWDSYVLVPPFEDENKNFYKLVLAERGSKDLLVSTGAAKAMVSKINAGTDESSTPNNSQSPPETRKQAILAQVARDFGLTPAEVDKAIRAWGKTVKDKHDEGLAKFYAENFEEARIAFTEAKEQLKREEEQLRSKIAESAYFEAKSYFRQTKYQEAIASYEEALTYRPGDTDILTDLAWALETIGQLDKAEPLLKQAIEISEKTFGQYHQKVANNLGALGSFYINRSDYKQGAALFERMVKVREKVKGMEHPSVAHDLSNLAVAYMALGNISEAEKSLERALAITEKNSGVESPDLTFTLNTISSLHIGKGNTLEAERVLKRSIDILSKTFEKSQDKAKARREGASNYAQAASALGLLYLRQGRIARAEPLLKDALEYEEMLGPLQPYDVKRLNELADLYERLGNFKAAEKLYARALKILENAVGKEHPSIIPELIDLAYVYESQKRYGDAQGLHLQVLKIVEKSERQNIGKALVGLAAFAARRKKLDEAEEYYKRALDHTEKTDGVKPSATIPFLDALANYYEKQDKFAESETYRKRVLAIEEAGGNLPRVARARNRMAQFYERQKKYAEAEDHYKRAEDAIEKWPEKKFDSIIPHLHDRADLYENQKRFPEAEQLYQRAVEITSKPGEPEYPYKAVTLNALANFYKHQKRYDEAAQLYTQAQAIIDNAKEPDARFKTALLFNRGKLLEDEKKYTEAEAIYRQYVLVVEKKYGPGHPTIGALHLTLAELAKQQGKNGEAEENFKHALSLFEQEMGQEDPNVAKTLESYAQLLRVLKREAEASAMENRAKKIRERLAQAQEGEN